MSDLLKLKKFDWKGFNEKKIRESILNKKSYSFVVGYEILKHYKTDSENQKNFLYAQNTNQDLIMKVNIDDHLNKFGFNQSRDEEIIEEEVKSSNDYDSKKIISIGSVNSVRSSINKYSKNNIYLENLKKLSQKEISKLKSIYIQYCLIDHIKSSTVIINS